MPRRAAAVTAVLVLALAGCGGPPPLRVSVPDPAPAERRAIAFASVELLEVSLPLYAEADQIFVAAPGRALRPLPGAVWADEPARALTLGLALALSQATGALVAPSPWPFDEPAEAVLDLRVTDFAAADFAVDGAPAFRLAGQAFVAARDGSGRDRALPFAVSVPIPAPDDPAAIAAARAQATAALAAEIAARGLR
jgi:uncharacterized lipoprotein YmbA